MKLIHTKLKISPIWKWEWEVLEKFTYYGRKKIVIKKGFIFDWASIPRIFYMIGTPMSTDTIY